MPQAGRTTFRQELPQQPFRPRHREAVLQIPAGAAQGPRILNGAQVLGWLAKGGESTPIATQWTENSTRFHWDQMCSHYQLHYLKLVGRNWRHRHPAENQHGVLGNFLREPQSKPSRFNSAETPCSTETVP